MNKMLRDYEIVSDERQQRQISDHKTVIRIRKNGIDYCYKEPGENEYKSLLRVNSKFLPDIVDYHKGCIIKEWVPGIPLYLMKPNAPTKKLIEIFTKYTENVFKDVHSSGMIVNDYLVNNIAVNNYGFKLFDCEFVDIEDKNVCPANGQLRPWESLLEINKDYNDDYFAYANVLYYFLFRKKSAFTNTEPDYHKAKFIYEKEYEAAWPKMKHKLESIGFSEHFVNFVIDCFNPFRENRPTRFMEI